MLPAAEVPDSFVDIFDAVAREDGGGGGRISAGGVHRTLSASKLGAEQQAAILGIVSPGGGDAAPLGRSEFNVLLALIGLAQEGDVVSLDGVDERRKST